LLFLPFFGHSEFLICHSSLWHFVLPPNFPSIFEGSHPVVYGQLFIVLVPSLHNK